MSAIPRFKRKCLDLDGSTKLTSNAGHYGNDSSIVSNAAQFAGRKFQAEKFNECDRPVSSVKNRDDSLKWKLRLLGLFCKDWSFVRLKDHFDLQSSLDLDAFLPDRTLNFRNRESTVLMRRFFRLQDLLM